MGKDVIEVETDAKGRFVERKNRFLGTVDIDGKVVEVHVRDPGRLEEILYEGNEVLVKKAKSKDRKTNWDLIAGKVKDNWIFVNSGYHREITEGVLEDEEISPYPGAGNITPEVQLGESRIDFLLERDGERIWMEVKGCTLAEDGVALFPDAPTERGKRHVEELRKAMEKGDRAVLLVLVFRPDAKCFAPKESTDPEFSEVFRKAVEEGMEVYPLKFSFEDDMLRYVSEIPVCNFV